MLEDIQNDINEDLDKNDEEEIDTKANLHLEIGLLEVSDQQERGSEEDFSRQRYYIEKLVSLSFDNTGCGVLKYRIRKIFA